MADEASQATAPDSIIDPISKDPPRHGHLDLLIISFALLFFELACIRWFGSTVVYLTFFTNFVLMACILGMSVGCLAAGRRRDFAGAVIPLTLVSVFLAFRLLRAFLFDHMSINVGDQSSPQQVYFGTEGGRGGFLTGDLPIEVVAGGCFAMITLVFVGLGQVLGRAFNAVPNRVAAYTWNILGSLGGILAFGVASYFRTSPQLWFALGLAPIIWFVRPWYWKLVQAAVLVFVLVLIGRTTALDEGRGREVIWSPYYKVVYHSDSGTIDTNNIGHQAMVVLENGGAAYELPYLLNRDAGGKHWDDLLIVGAGSGNDVQAALLQGAKRVDAVEIDPVLNELGRAHHPEHPYDDSRVHVHLDDGRSFVRNTSRRYDAAVYALVDSLVLHSGYSSLRLESFLFTEQAFADVRDKLKPDGVFIVYNYFRQGWVISRIAAMAERAFGTRPIVISLPYRAKITPGQNQAGAITLLMVGKDDAALAPIRARLERENFWLHVSPKYNAGVNAFGTERPKVAGTSPEHWRKIGLSKVEGESGTRVPTDNWPFLYLRGRIIPWLNVRGMLIVVVISLLVLRLFAPSRTFRPNGQMFFLGAGFMLLETKGVVHLALLFGSTWVVNSIVFFAILVMILLSNLYVLAVRPRRLGPYYALLIAGLLINIAVPMTRFLALPGAAKVVVSCAVVFVPIFFAGVVFATSFRDSARPDLDLGSNIAGVILGGLSEYFSLVVGFNGLVVLAIVYYVLSAVLGSRQRGKPLPTVPA